MTSAEIRQTFLDFFKSKGHHIVPSAPIVVKNDPTLLFTNAGMNQFKDYFLGNKNPENKRVADTQKCLRVSGKHNDLEEVGVDTYHHTMFEMLGNWSFGDYFKAEAIAWSWELLTEVLKLDKSRLYVTIFEGDAKEGLPKDSEAYNEWKKVISEDRILLGKKKDNFWEMGDTGPCGPCTEIHVDCRTDEERRMVDGKTLVNNDHPQVIEIWNNVFIQFNRKKDGSLEELPAKHVDTGMGFERLVRVIQNKTSNYDTDVFTGTITAIENIVSKKYDYSDSKEAIAFRVLADHIRAISFTIADGQLPSNTGAGYVIRRILRRAVRYYYSYLNYKQPLLHQLLPVIAKQFENVFPELIKQQDFVTKVIKEEEDAFLRTLASGIQRFEKYADDRLRDGVTRSSQGIIIDATTPIKIDGNFAFELYDTFGFPIDLTELMAREKGIVVDMVGFNNALQQQKTRSRVATAIDTDDWVVVNDVQPIAPKDYNDLMIETTVAKYRRVSAKGKEQYQIVLSETPFYAESGGQVGDRGWLQFGDEKIAVVDTKKENDSVIHFVEKLPATVDGTVIANVDQEKRLYTMYNHTATHLMHAALRKVLGTHVAQKGSLVNEHELRFDFSHFAKMTEEEIRAVEKMVNDKIRENIPVVIRTMPKEEALKLGAMALFGEKYGDVVRVVTIDPNYSVELCGGTHVMHTGMIGMFKINAESAVASGVRRIEALTGSAAYNFLYDQLMSLKEVATLLKTKDPLKAVEKIVLEKQELEKYVERLEVKQLNSLKQELLREKENIASVAFIGKVVEVNNADYLKKLCFDLKNDLGNDYVVVLAANINGKPNVAVMLSDSVVAEKQLEAPAIIKQHIAPLIKGGGGGQKTLASAGGQDASNLQRVIERVKELL
ncbi:MAG: alanine--tRNA ligase [Sphingobacteriia bacterium]|nr:alanine--tRNA ligase [Sphingobacteriia bacterium]